MGNSNSAAHDQVASDFMPSRSDSGNGDISIVKPHKTSGDNRQKLLLRQSSSPKHRTMRNPTHTTQLTFDEMTTASMNTFNTDDAAALNQERKQKLQEKLRYQQDRFLKRNEGLHLKINGNCNDDRPASPDSPDHMAISEHSSGVELQEQAQQEEAPSQDSPHRTNRLRTRSIQQDNPKDQWQNAWDEDSDATSDDEEGDEHLHHVQRDRLNSDVSKQVDNELTRGEDAVKWDSGTENIVDLGYSKPHLEMFSQLRVLGKGSFGKVILTQKQSGEEKGKLFAMKILRKTHLLKKQQISRTRTERKVLSIVDHPFIMKLHFAFQTDDRLFLVLDYCAGGELFFHLSRHKRFSEGWTRFYAAELILALEYLHSKGIIYRDLKPENILLDSAGHVKLGDFGLAKAHIRHPYEGAKSRVGTPEYMAPEVIKKMGHGFTVDYWGLGMVTYEMMTGLPPWYTEDRSKIFKRLLRSPLSFPSNVECSPHLMNFIASLLNRSPHQRLGVRGSNSVKVHAFFRRLDFKLVERRGVQAPIRPCEGWKAPESEKTKKGKLLGMMFGGSRQGNNASLHTMQSEEVDAATANFDQAFTRMSLVSGTSHDYDNDDDLSDDDCGSSQREELNANSFVGFTFEDQDDR